MTDPQQAHHAVQQWAPVVSWLASVESTITSAPEIGGVDTDQISEAEDAVRAARLAVAALVGAYATEVTTAPAQQPAQPATGGWQQPTTAAQQWAQRQQIAAARPGDQLAQQPGPPQQAPAPNQYAGGWPQ